MRLFPAELDIGVDEGFSPERDIFKRKPFGDQLIKIVRALDGPIVILFDAPWGTGKTTFVKMWCGELNRLNIPNVYFDAFANDYHENAFLALAAEIIAKVEDLKPRDRRALSKFKKNAVSVAKVLGRASLRVGVRVATAGILSGSEFEEGGKAISEAVNSTGEEAAKSVDEIGVLLKERLESHKADHAAFRQFNEALLALSQSLVPEGQTKANGAKQQLIFVIDELDRCRPDFALELLEKIKHFFAVSGMVFVLVTNLKQLESATRAVYGDINANEYLEKFFHLRFSLPPQVEQVRNDLVSIYTIHLLQKVLPENVLRNELPHVVDFLSAANTIHPVSLRTLERICSYIGIVLVSTEKNQFLPTPIVVGLCFLKVVAPAIYESARSRKISYSNINQIFHFGDWREGRDLTKTSSLGEWCEDHWHFALGELRDQKKLGEFSQGLHRYNLRSPGDIVPMICQLIDGFSFPNP